MRGKLSPIISDKWASDQGIETMSNRNCTHEMVNHTDNFVDSTTGAQTQTMESLWHVYKTPATCGQLYV